jgi:two-component system chemotaxis response regulator CheB
VTQDATLDRVTPPSAQEPLPVVVIAGTRVRIGALAKILSDPALTIVGGARTGVEVEALLHATAPRAVLLDLDLDAGGLDIIERIMAARPIPIVVVGAAALRPEAALGAGAVDVVGALDVDPSDPAYARMLVRHLQVASRVRVISHPRARLRRRPSEEAPASTGRTPLVAIGASTGGPPALAQVIAELPRGFEAAVLVVQHMADGFVEGLARWLDEACRLPVVVAADGERIRPGVVHLAPAGTNLEVGAGNRVRLTPPQPGQFNVPGVDVTFRSVAQAAGPLAVGVLLTGMGRDGALGLRAMRDAGATTIGQDEATSVVWGMPGAAQEVDAVGLELPLDEIGAAIVTSLRRARLGSGRPTGGAR